MNMEIPNQLSDKTLNAITKAIAEEKVPLSKRLLKIIAYTVALSGMLFIFAFLAFNRKLSASWAVAFCGWFVILFGGFFLYFKPQPRLVISGDFSPWIVAKILISMTVATVLEIAICPSFVVADLDLAWNPFKSVSEAFMSWGGMAGCMFLCGLIFVGLGSSIAFLFVAKNLSGSSRKNFIGAMGIALLTQLPILGIQLFDASLRMFIVHWICGGLIGMIFMGLLIRAISTKLRANRFY